MDLQDEVTKIIKDKEFDKTTTEYKVLGKIDSLLLDWPIDDIKTRDDFIRFLFRTYQYSWKYKPFVSFTEVFLRYLIVTMLIVLVWVAIWAGLIDLDWTKGNLKSYKSIWIILANVTYLIIAYYMWVRVYTHIRRLIRKEVKKWLFIWLQKVIFMALFVSFTWFIWQFIASLAHIIWFSVNEWIKEFF